MIIFIKKDKIVEKCSVEINKEELEKLRIEIIEKCSEIVHHEYDLSSRLPEDFVDDSLKIRNFKETKIGERDIDPRKSPIKKLYHYSYDQLEYPYLITIINNMLKGKESAIEEILNPDFSKERKSIDEKIKELQEELNSKKLSVSEEILVLNRIKKLLETKKLNENQESVLEYYDKVKNLITLTRIDFINVEQLKRIYDFFEIKELKAIKNKTYQLKK